MTSRLDHEVASREAVEERYRRLHHKFTALSTGSSPSIVMSLVDSLSFGEQKAHGAFGVCAETSSLLTDLDDGDRARGHRRRAG